MELTREQALALLRQYNEEPFHLRHALTVEAVMNWFARELGYGEEAAFWAQAGLLHDLDFERYPEYQIFHYAPPRICLDILPYGRMHRAKTIPQSLWLCIIFQYQLI